MGNFNHKSACCGHSEAFQEPRSLSNRDELLAEFTQRIPSPPDEMCSVCMGNLQHPSDFCDDDEEELTKDILENTSDSQGSGSVDVIQLVLCNHTFHLACVKQMLETSPDFLQCPYCKTIHGVKKGNQPPGKMQVWRLPNSIPGYPNCGTIIITYSFQNGIQGPDHPNPGKPYRAHSFPRSAFLPDDAKGNKVLKLLQEAWRRRLIFTVGTSATSGMQNVITWNDIHHKTEWHSNESGHGYPDEFYLDRVLMELEMAGVTDETT